MLIAVNILVVTIALLLGAFFWNEGKKDTAIMIMVLGFGVVPTGVILKIPHEYSAIVARLEAIDQKLHRLETIEAKLETLEASCVDN